MGTPFNEQACISRSARGAVWGVLTCLFVLSRYKGPKIFFACGAPRIPLEISKETVFSLQCFSFGPGAVLGGAYMLVRGHACSPWGVRWNSQDDPDDAGAALPLNASKEANPLLLDPSSGARVTVASAGPKGFTTFGDSSSGDILARNMLSGDASATGQDDSGVDGGGGAPGTAAAKDYEHRRLLRLGIRRREEALAKRRAEMLRKRTIRDNYACVEQKLAKEAQHELRRQLRDLGQEAAADTPNRRRARRKAARRRGQRQGSEGGADEGDEDLVARKSKKRSRPSGSSSACDLHRTLWQYVWTPHDRAGTLRRPHLITQHACALVTHVYAFVQSLLRIAHF